MENEASVINKNLTIETSTSQLPELNIVDAKNLNTNIDNKKIKVDENFSVSKKVINGDNNYIFKIDGIDVFSVKGDTLFKEVLKTYYAKIQGKTVEEISLDIDLAKNTIDFKIKSKSELDNLKQTTNINMMNMLEGTGMYNKQIDIYKTELKAKGIVDTAELDKQAKEKFKEFSDKIGTTIKNYLTELFGVDFLGDDAMCDRAFASMSVGVQFAMLETLIGQDATKNNDFFSNFSKIDTHNSSSAFSGLWDTFKGGDAFYTLASKFENCAQYLASHKGELTATTKLMMNPYYFKKVIQDGIRATKPNVELDKLIFPVDGSLTFVDKADNGVAMTDVQRDELKKIANDQKLLEKITPELLETLGKKGGTLDKAATFISSRASFSKNAIGIMSGLDSLLSYEIPLLGSIGSLLGYESTKDFMMSTEKDKDGNIVQKKGILDFILGIMGFKGGKAGLFEQYSKEQLDFYLKGLNINNNKFLQKSCLTYNSSSSIASNDTNGSTWKALNLDTVVTESAAREDIKKILPPDYAGLKASIKEGLKESPKIPTEILSKIGGDLDGIVNPDTLCVVPGREDVFVNIYLKYSIDKLLHDNDFVDYVNSQSPNQYRAFSFGIFGHMVAGKYFEDAIKTVSIDSYFGDSVVDSTNDTNSQANGNIEDNNYIAPTYTDVENSTISLDNSNIVKYIKNSIIKDESGNRYDAIASFDVNGVSIGLMQWHDVRAKFVFERMKNAYPDDFKKIMGEDFVENISKDVLWTTDWKTKYPQYIDRYKRLMRLNKFKEVMDQQVDDDIKSYIKVSPDYGIPLTSKKEIIMFASMQNAGIGWAKNSVLVKIDKPYTIENIYTQIKTTAYYKKYSGVRRHYDELYSKLKVINVNEVQLNNIV